MQPGERPAPRSARIASASSSVGTSAPVAHVAVLVAGEEQAAEGRVRAVQRAGPPHDRLVAGPGERDVGEAQVLAALLVDVPAAVSREPGPSHRRRRWSAGRPWRRRGRRPARRLVGDASSVPQVRAVDDGELEALAAVDGEDLHGLGVGLEAAAAVLVVGVLVGLGDPPAQPGVSAVAPRLLGVGRGVQQLADVAQVGQLALARRPGQDPRRAGARPASMVSSSDGHAAAAQHAAQPVQAASARPPSRARRRPRHLLGGPADEAGQGGRRARAIASVGRSSASSRRSHSRGRSAWRTRCRRR